MLQLGAGITPSQIRVSGDSADNLTLTDGISGDTIKLDREMYQTSYYGQVFGVESLQFADGTIWSRADLIQLSEQIPGTTGADTLSGTPGGDTFDGKGAPAGSQDYESGGGGGDTFIYNPGYGQLEILEQDYGGVTAILKFGGSVTSSSVTVAMDSARNVYITDGTAGDLIKIDYGIYSGNYGLQSVHFNDGSSLSQVQLITMLTPRSSSTTFDLSTGGNMVNLGAGDGSTVNTVIFGRGDGAATVVMNGGGGVLN